MYARYLLCAGLFIAGCAGAFSQSLKKTVRPTRGSQPIVLDETMLRQAIFDTAATFVGRTEKNDRNDAAWITAINRFNHLPAQAMYCASGLYYVHAKNGVLLPVGAVGRVASYFRDPSKIVYRRGTRGNQRLGHRIRKMDLASLFASHIEGIAQDRYDPSEDETVLLIGFNTTGGRGTRGGCYINRRRTGEIKLIANWLTPYLEQYQSATASKMSF